MQDIKDILYAVHVKRGQYIAEWVTRAISTSLNAFGSFRRRVYFGGQAWILHHRYCAGFPWLDFKDIPFNMVRAESTISLLPYALEIFLRVLQQFSLFGKGLSLGAYILAQLKDYFTGTKKFTILVRSTIIAESVRQAADTPVSSPINALKALHTCALSELNSLLAFTEDVTHMLVVLNGIGPPNVQVLQKE